MQARQLLQGLADQIQVQSQVQETEVRCTPISASTKEAAMTVLVPIEGSIRVLEVHVKESGTYEGLE